MRIATPNCIGYVNCLSWHGDVTKLMLLCFGSVMQTNYQDQDSELSEVQSLKEVSANDRVCTLCEEFASEALDYLAENKTQTEIFDALHQACNQIGSFKHEVMSPFSQVDILDKTLYFCCKTVLHHP